MPLLYVHDGDAFVVVGSNWGQAHHPGWSNLLADPAATVQVGDKRMAVRATQVEGPDRDRLWAQLRDVWPAYEAYRTRSGRELRMFRLEPQPGVTRKGANP